MSETPALVYLEADDEITTVVRRVRAAEAGRVVVVAPGRARATSSAVALRLLARVGADEGREVVLVGDALTRSLAAEAGLPAFGSVEEARSAVLGPEAPSVEEPRHAAIHVVRGAATEDTVAAPVVPVISQERLGSLDETRAVEVQRPRPVPATLRGRGRGRRRRRPSLGLAALLGMAGALLVAGVVAGAMLLPAADITIVPRSVPVDAVYEIMVDDPVRHAGTVEAAATVTATGTYETSEAASGSVVFLNWTFFPVEVPAGTFVAAGEQAFATQADITVPRGRLTGQGTIAAGEQGVAVVAAAAGPAANVEAGAIETVVTQEVDARLRGFPENPQPRVRNPEPTSGGVQASGPEITEADVEAAVGALREELRERAADAPPDLGDLVLVAAPPSEPVIEVPEDLVGTRDVPEVEITGSLDWELIAVDRSLLEQDAGGRLASDPALPDEHELLDGSVGVDLGDPILREGEVVVEAEVTGLAAPLLDREAIIELVRGRPEAEARLALADLGQVDVVLWPGWVASVPELEWRIDVRIEEPES